MIDPLNAAHLSSVDPHDVAYLFVVNPQIAAESLAISRVSFMLIFQLSIEQSFTLAVVIDNYLPNQRLAEILVLFISTFRFLHVLCTPRLLVLLSNCCYNLPQIAININSSLYCSSKSLLSLFSTASSAILIVDFVFIFSHFEFPDFSSSSSFYCLKANGFDWKSETTEGASFLSSSYLLGLQDSIRVCILKENNK